jgi:hypothetical protein
MPAPSTSFADLVRGLCEGDEWPPPTDCPWYKKGFCALDGSVCPYSSYTYEECPKFMSASQHPEAVVPVLD